MRNYGTKIIIIHIYKPLQDSLFDDERSLNKNKDYSWGVLETVNGKLNWLWKPETQQRDSSSIIFNLIFKNNESP